MLVFLDEKKKEKNTGECYTYHKWMCKLRMRVVHQTTVGVGDLDPARHSRYNKGHVGVDVMYVCVLGPDTMSRSSVIAGTEE